MGGGEMRLRYRGLLREKHGKGIRWRVRVKGDNGKKITLPVTPDDKDFHAHYAAAREGRKLNPVKAIKAKPGTMGWLLETYITHLETMVEAGQASPLTLKERKNLCQFVLRQTSTQSKTSGQLYHGLPMTIPSAELISLKDRMAKTPGKALNVWKFLTSAYDYGVEREHIGANPIRAIPRPTYKSKGGAKPWTMDDLAKYRKIHAPGTMAHLCLTLFMFTACRISDAYLLGREHEERHEGALWLAWQPAKKGSKFVRIPVLLPLQRALRAQTVVGTSYLLTEHGAPFKSAEGLRNRFKKWCREAGIEDRSSHGIRKAAGHLLALHGATQYEIMAVHGHANAATSQVYTESVERMRLGQMAVSKLAGLEW